MKRPVKDSSADELRLSVSSRNGCASALRQGSAFSLPCLDKACGCVQGLSYASSRSAPHSRPLVSPPRKSIVVSPLSSHVGMQVTSFSEEGKGVVETLDPKGLTLCREDRSTPGRTCGTHASCGTREARIGGAMSERSDAERVGSRQTRRGASMARSKAAEQREAASDEARRRDSAMDGAGDAGRGACASKARRQASPSALESAKRGLSRGRSRAQRFGLCRVGSHATRRHTCVCREVDGAIKSAKATSRARLPRLKPQH